MNTSGQSISFWTPTPKMFQPYNLRTVVRALLRLWGNPEEGQLIPPRNRQSGSEGKQMPNMKTEWFNRACECMKGIRITEQNKSWKVSRPGHVWKRRSWLCEEGWMWIRDRRTGRRGAVCTPVWAHAHSRTCTHTRPQKCLAAVRHTTSQVHGLRSKERVFHPSYWCQLPVCWKHLY